MGRRNLVNLVFQRKKKKTNKINPKEPSPDTVLLINGRKTILKIGPPKTRMLKYALYKTSNTLLTFVRLQQYDKLRNNAFFFFFLIRHYTRRNHRIFKSSEPVSHTLKRIAHSPSMSKTWRRSPEIGTVVYTRER